MLATKNQPLATNKLSLKVGEILVTSHQLLVTTTHSFWLNCKPLTKLDSIIIIGVRAKSTEAHMGFGAYSSISR